MAYSQPRPGQRITPELLSSVAGLWRPYTATLTNLSLGNGTLITRYQTIANRVTVAWNLAWGSTTSGNMPIISLPVPPAALGGMRWTGQVTISEGDGSAWQTGWAVLTDAANSVSTYAVTGTAAITSSLASAGITMTSAGWLQGSIEYEM
jgi:hypothetical protein